MSNRSDVSSSKNTMKSLFVIAVLVAIIACTQAKRCHDNKKCGEDECCMTKSLRRSGRCVSLSKENKRCTHDPINFGILGDKYLRHCPCAEGLVCNSEETKIIPERGEVKVNERCVKPSETTTPAEITEGEVTAAEEEVTATEEEDVFPEAD